MLACAWEEPREVEEEGTQTRKANEENNDISDPFGNLCFAHPYMVLVFGYWTPPNDYAGCLINMQSRINIANLIR